MNYTTWVDNDTAYMPQGNYAPPAGEMWYYAPRIELLTGITVVSWSSVINGSNVWWTGYITDDSIASKEAPCTGIYYRQTPDGTWTEFEGGSCTINYLVNYQSYPSVPSKITMWLSDIDIDIGGLTGETYIKATFNSTAMNGLSIYAGWYDLHMYPPEYYYKGLWSQGEANSSLFMSGRDSDGDSFDVWFAGQQYNIIPKYWYNSLYASYGYTSTDITIVKDGHASRVIVTDANGYEYTNSYDPYDYPTINVFNSTAFINVSSPYGTWFNYTVTNPYYGTQSPFYTCWISLWCHDAVTTNTMSCDWNIYFGTQETWENHTDAITPFQIGVLGGEQVQFTTAKTGYTTQNNTYTFSCNVSQLNYHIFLQPTCNAPSGQTCLYVDAKTYVTGSGYVPLSGVYVTVNNQTKTTSVYGITMFYVPNNATYTVTGTKSGYMPATTLITMSTYPDTAYLYLSATVPTMALPTPTPLPTTTVPPKNVGDIIVGRITALIGNLLFAAIIIFASMYAGFKSTGQALGGIAGGAVGFIISTFLGLISFVWFVALIAIVGGLLAWKAYGSVGGA